LAGSPTGESGFAMIMTLTVMMITMALVAVIFAAGIEALPLARQAQDYQAALQAADAGVQDYINRLDDNTTYYLETSDPSNPALENGSSWTTWAPVAGTSSQEWYRYAVDASRATRTGAITLTVSGAAGQDPSVPGDHYTVRTIRVELNISGFTSFLYYTDYEIESPAISGLPNSCVVHAWQWNGSGYGPPASCSGEIIYFVGSSTVSDGLNGPIYSNDELHICGTPSFPEGATSAYDQGSAASVAYSTQYGNPGTYYPAPGCFNDPSFGGKPPQPAGSGYSPFPATNTDLASDLSASSQGGGCGYTGPIDVTFNSSGTMSVSLLRGSSATPPSAGVACTGTDIPLPPNGLIYDQTAKTCSTMSCRADVSVSGTVSGQVTVGSDYDVTVVGNLVDASTAGSDIIGLSAANSIILDPVYDLTVDAAMVALDNSIYVENFASIPPEGTLTVLGSMAQKFRGPVGTFYGDGTLASGYAKNYNYDSRLRFLQPPYFTQPTLPDWVETSFAECQATPTPSTSGSC